MRMPYKEAERKWSFPIPLRFFPFEPTSFLYMHSTSPSQYYEDNSSIMKARSRLVLGKFNPYHSKIMFTFLVGLLSIFKKIEFSFLIIYTFPQYLLIMIKKGLPRSSFMKKDREERKVSSTNFWSTCRSYAFYLANIFEGLYFSSQHLCHNDEYVRREGLTLSHLERRENNCIGPFNRTENYIVLTATMIILTKF